LKHSVCFTFKSVPLIKVDSGRYCTSAQGAVSIDRLRCIDALLIKSSIIYMVLVQRRYASALFPKGRHHTMLRRKDFAVVTAAPEILLLVVADRH